MMDFHPHNMDKMRQIWLSTIERDLFFFMRALGELQSWWNVAVYIQIDQSSKIPTIMKTLEAASHSIKATCEAQQNAWKMRVSARKRKSDAKTQDYSVKCRKI